MKSNELGGEIGVKDDNHVFVIFVFGAGAEIIRAKDDDAFVDDEDFVMHIARVAIQINR